MFVLYYCLPLNEFTEVSLGHSSSQKIFKQFNALSKTGAACSCKRSGTTAVTVTMAEMVTTRSNFKVRFKPFLEVPFRVASNNKLQIIVKLDKASTIQDANDLRTYVI